jgi:hypothetical protein
MQAAPQAPPNPGHFVVTGVWLYTEKNLAALNEVLGELRALYHDQPIGTDPKGATGVCRRLIASGRVHDSPMRPPDCRPASPAAPQWRFFVRFPKNSLFSSSFSGDLPIEQR